MAVTRTQKVSILQHLNQNVSSQKAVVLIGTKGAKTTLDSAKNFEFRKSCHDQGVIIEVAKNTLIQRAFPAISSDLVGQTYVAYLEDGANGDEVTTPKIVVQSVGKTFSDYFNIIGSVVNGEFYDAKATDSLSKVPSFNDSMAMLAGTINQITAKIAISIKEIPAGVARGIQAAKA